MLAQWYPCTVFPFGKIKESHECQCFLVHHPVGRLVPSLCPPYPPPPFKWSGSDRGVTLKLRKPPLSFVSPKLYIQWCWCFLASSPGQILLPITCKGLQLHRIGKYQTEIWLHIKPTTSTCTSLSCINSLSSHPVVGAWSLISRLCPKTSRLDGLSAGRHGHPLHQTD